MRKHAIVGWMLILGLCCPSFGEIVVPLDGEGWTCDGIPVVVPHTWNAQDACDGPGATKEPRNGDSAASRTSYLRKRSVYRRMLPSPMAGTRRVFLKCDGASVIAEVSVNGRFVGKHVGAFTAFAFEITEYLQAVSNVLEIAVDNRLNELTQPLSADFSVYGGLYRSVKLIETDLICIDRVTDGADGVDVSADPLTGNVEVRIAVLGGTNEVRRFSVPDFKLWSPEQPKIYTRRIEVLQKGCRDAATIRFAFRTMEFRQDGFYLNGERRQLRGVNRHQDREGKGWAVSGRDEEEDIRLIKELGADALRTAHYPQSRHIYDLCDELGLICWVEYPNVNRVLFTEGFERGMLTQIREMVRQLGNHPSIAMWSICNELEMDGSQNGWLLDPEKTRQLLVRVRDFIHRLDAERPVVAATDKPKSRSVNDVTDQLAYNRYPGWYSRQTMRQMLDDMFAADDRKILGMSEYGVGGSIQQHDDPSISVRPNGPWHPEEYQAFRMHDNLLELMREPCIWGHYVWAMFDFGADRRTEGATYGKNDKGLMAFNHRDRKDVYYLYKANWRKDVPVLHLVGSRMTSLTNSIVTVLGFSNIGDVRLQVNGRDCGLRAPDDACGVIWKDVRLDSGHNDIRLESGGRTVSARWLVQQEIKR